MWSLKKEALYQSENRAGTGGVQERNRRKVREISPAQVRNATLAPLRPAAKLEQWLRHRLSRPKKCSCHGVLISTKGTKRSCPKPPFGSEHRCCNGFIDTIQSDAIIQSSLTPSVQIIAVVTCSVIFSLATAAETARKRDWAKSQDKQLSDNFK